MADLAGGAARRRRERRLRSWLRHERMTVRMELAAALHHSAGPETNDAVRSQKTVSSRGVRPGVLQDPAPQLVVEHAARPCSGVPLLAIPCLGGGADGVDDTTTRFLLKKALLRKKEEEKEKRKEEMLQRKHDELFALLDMPFEHRTPDQQSRPQVLMHEYHASKRKRKKRRKRRTPRTSFLFGRARRRLRQWSACSAGFTGDDVPRVMFPSGVARPKMLCIMASLVQMDSYSGMARLCFFPFFRPLMLGIMAGMDQVAWFAGILRCPSCYAPLVVSGPRCPSSWPAWTTGQYGGSQVQSGQGFLHARCCAMCGVLVQTVQYTVWRFRSCSSSRSSTLPLCAVAVPHGPVCSENHRDSSVRIWWSMSLFAGFPQVQSWIDCSGSQLQLLTLGLGVQACKFHRCGL